MRRFWHWCWRGFAMGCAELVPGISGMTVALLTGVYPTFLSALALLSRRSWWQSLWRSPGAALQKLQIYNLTSLLLGMALAVLLLASAIQWLWQHQQPLLQAFFLGLVLASGVRMLGALWRGGALRSGGQAATGGSSPGHPPEASSERAAAAELPAGQAATLPVLLPTLLLGAALALGLHFIGAVGGGFQGWPGWVLGGALASVTWLLPGLSGSLLLLIIGLYDPMIDMLASVDVAGLLPFAGGVLLGVLALGRAVEHCWRSYPLATRSLAVGMVLGSLYALLPSQWHLGALPVLALGALLGWMLVGRNE